MQLDIVTKLIEHFGGTQEKLASALNVKQGTVTGWLNKKHGIGESNALKIEKLTQGKFKAIELCPRLAELENLEPVKDKAPSGN